MDGVAILSDKERGELFEATAQKKNITPAAAEKDFWICWVLAKIFSNEFLKQILKFKGGTSLSKCFHLIERFSEDIDLILDWSQLTESNPTADRSRNQQDKLNKSINNQAKTYIRDKIFPVLRDSFGQICVLELDSADAHSINIHYPAVFTSPYLLSQVKLEIGPLAAMVPSTVSEVCSYAAEEFPSLFKDLAVNVPTIIPERTFWEKATILHAEAHRPSNKRMSPRYSRHYYDLYKMNQTAVGAESLKRLDLLVQVREFKQKFYASAWANYEEAKPGSFKLAPPVYSPDPYRQDYAAMSEMIFGEIPAWDVILSALKDLEDKINSLE